MNRQQRREQVKKLQREGVKRTAAKNLVEKYYALELEEGTRVKINYEFCIRHPEWANQDEDFKAWVEEHKDEIFTVEYDNERVPQNSVGYKVNVCLKEDTTEPKWLFHAATLTPIPTCTVDLEDGESFKIDLDGINDANDPRIQEMVNKAIEERKEKNKEDTE